VPGIAWAVTGRGEERLDRLADELGRPAELLTLVGDAADWDAVSTAVETTVRRPSGVDVNTLTVRPVPSPL
jgi:NADP-dependent 3-hydroxy acid dehydrogenase YdfG